MGIWKQKKVLVTGASGFVGSHLAERLATEEARVKAFVHYNSRNDWGNLENVDNDILDDIDVIAGDLTDPLSVENAVKGCEIVFHLGALVAIPYSYIASRQYISTNVLGTVNVLEACRKSEVLKMVHTSTSEVYGTALYTPIDENHPLQAQSPYSASKISADKMVESYHRSYNLPVTTIRPFNTFGPRQSARAVIPTIISQVLSGKNIELGTLDSVRDFTFIVDSVDGFLSIAQSEKAIGETINIGNGKGIKIIDLTHLILDIMGIKDAKIISHEKRIRPKESEVFELICDNSRAKEICKWTPKYGLREGLEETIDWMKQNSNRFKPNIYNI